MAESLYIEYLESRFKPTVDSIVKKINGEEGDRTYLHDKMLTPKNAIQGKWESVTSDNVYVMANFVSTDSELPVKRRASLGKVTGNLVKSGMALSLNETQMQELDTMMAMNADELDIMDILMDDSTKCIRGEKELMECAFLEELSTGVCAIDDEEHEGLAVRIDAGYLDENKFTPQYSWADPNTAKPLDDFERIIEAAEAKKRDLNFVWMDNTAWKQFRDSKQVREYVQGRDKKVYIGGQSASDLPKSSLAEINKLLAEDETYGNVQIRVIRFKAVREKKDHTYETIVPWARGMVVFTRSEKVGKLWWADVAEDKHRVEGTTYVKIGNSVLLSKYTTNQPTLQEWTKIQGRQVPVIDGAEGIYQLDTQSVTTDGSEDNKITIAGTEHKKSDVLTAFTTVTGITLPAGISDAVFVALFNTLSKKVQADIVAAIVDTPDEEQGGGGGQ